MNDFIKMIVNRRTIRKYQSKQISENELNAILDAGLHAPNAGGRQSPIIAVSQNTILNNELGRINRSIHTYAAVMGNVSTEQPSIADDGNISNAFYDAPTVLTLFAKKGVYNYTGDCFVAAENIIVAAHSLGIGSCMVCRAKETFATERGIEIQKLWGINDEFEAKIHVTLGYPDGNAPNYKPRKENRIIRI
jgi:nitroreductase